MSTERVFGKGNACIASASQQPSVPIDLRRCPDAQTEVPAVLNSGRIKEFPSVGITAQSFRIRCLSFTASVRTSVQFDEDLHIQHPAQNKDPFQFVLIVSEKDELEEELGQLG